MEGMAGINTQAWPQAVSAFSAGMAGMGEQMPGRHKQQNLAGRQKNQGIHAGVAGRQACSKGRQAVPGKAWHGIHKARRRQGQCAGRQAGGR